MKQFIWVLLFFLTINIYSQEIDFKRNIKVTSPRMNGIDIIAVQQKLLDLGYTDVGQIDGWFGPNSEKSVKIFQEDFNLSITGEIDHSNWELLFSERTVSLKNIIDFTKSEIENNGYKTEEYDFEQIPQNGPGYPLLFLVNLTLDRGQIKTVKVRLVGDGSGYNYTAFYNNENQIIKLEKVWWGYNFETEQTENRSITHFFFENNQCIGINAILSNEWIFEVSEKRKKELEDMRVLILDAISHRN